MNKKVLSVILAFCFYQINAQVNINNYVYTTSTSASLARTNGSLIDDIDMSTGTTVVLGGSAITNTISSTANLNFDFYSGGTRFTNFTVTPNGWVGLGGGVSPAILWASTVSSGTRIAPFLGPLLNTNVPPLSSMTTSSIGRIHYKLVGTSPSRVGVIEFLRMSVNSSVVDDTTTFQVRLYESNGAIEMVYGRMKVTVGAPLDFNIGFKIAAGSHSVNTSNNTSSTIATNTNTYSSNTYIPNLHNYTNGSQRAYLFKPNRPNDPTNFTISNITNNSMTLNWTDASNETGYVLYRSVDGGVTYTFVQQLAANVVTYNATGLIGGTDVYWRLYSLRESLGNQVDNMATTLNSAVVTSVTDGNWNSPLTWSTGIIPNANDSVQISAGDTVVVNIANATCLRLSVNGSLHYNGTTSNVLTIMTDLIVNPGGAIRDFATTTSTNQLGIGGANTASTTNGSLINNGIIDIDNGTQGVTLNMFGNGNATITGTPTVFQLRNIQLQKNNSINNIVEVFTPFSVALTTNLNTLTIQSGTLKLSCAINLTPYGSPTSSVLVNSANGRLWLNHASAIINSTTTTSTSSFYQILGELRIDNGTLNIGAGNSQFLVGTSKIIINNGTFNLLGTFQSTSTGTFEMNGGNLNINPINGATAIPATTAALLFAATSNITWTGGTINVINPQTLNNNVSVNILAGANKIITGGLLKIGNGLQNGTGPNAVNTSGFGLTSTVPLYDVLIDSRFDLSSGRLVRIIGTFMVGRNLTLAAGTTVLPASGNVGGNLNIKGNLINNGDIIGNFPVSASIVGLVNFEGTSSQTISGTGSFNNLANLTINNPAGVTSTSTIFGNVIRLNLYTGLLTTNGTLTIGSNNSRGTIQIGGIDELTTAGSLSTVPLFNVSFATHRYIYGPSSSTLNFGAFNEIPISTNTLSSLTLLDLGGLNLNRNITILDTLNLGAYHLNINNNSLSIGNSTAQVGRIIRTTGFVKMGASASFGRWYATGTVLNNTLLNSFPILANNQDRSVILNSDGNAITTGGKFTVTHNNLIGNTDFSPATTDGIVNVDRISNSYWVFNLSGINVSSFFGLQVFAQMQGVGSVSSLNELRWMKPGLGSSNTSTGTGTLNNPVISRLFSQSQVSTGVVSDTFYVGVNSLTNTLTPTYIAIADGSWDDPNTWNNNSVPSSNNIVIIPSPYEVNLNTSTALNSVDSVAILSGGKLSIDANTLTVNRNILCDGLIKMTSGVLNISGIDQAGLTIGLAGSLNISGGKINIGNSAVTNKTLTANGIVNLSDSGEINMFGNVLFNAGATFNQTGGDLKIDGNSGTAFTSLLAGKHLLDINTDNINCSGGNITFIDPPHSSLSALSTYTLRISATSNLTAFSGTHTFIFGDGISTTLGNNSGFNVDNRKSGIVPVKNIIVNGGSGSGRWLAPSYSSGSFGLYALGNLTINSGSELRQTNASQLVIGGNIINNGTLTTTQTFTLGGLGYNVLNAQTISGSGVFRNSTSSTTAEFTTMVLNNGGTNFNLGSSIIRFSNALTLTSGLVNAGTNILKIPATASISRTNGYITVGALELNFATGTNVAKTYFVGGSNGYTPTILTFPSVTTAGDVRLTLTNSDHSQISSGCFDNNQSINKNWNINNISVAPYLLNADLSYTSADIDAGTTISSIAGKKYNGSSWSVIPLVSVSGTNTVINGLNSNGTIQLGDTINGSVSISIATANTTACYGTNVTYTATVTAGGSSPIYQWKKNGANVGSNSDTYVNSSVTKTDTVWCLVTSNLACASVLNATSNTLIVRVGNLGINTGLTSTHSNFSNIHICQGSNTGLMTFSNDLPVNIIRWDTMNTRVSNNWGAINNTNSTYTSGSLNAYGHDYGSFSVANNANFKVIYNYIGCTDTAESNIINFVVDPPAVATTLTNGSTCTGNCDQVCLGSNYTGGFELVGVYSGFSVQSAVAPFTTWNSFSNPITQTIRVRAVALSGVCVADTSPTHTITAIPTAIKGTFNGNQTICAGSATGVVYSGFNGFIDKWRYSVSPFTTWNDIASQSQITSMPISQTTKFVAITYTDPKCSRAYSDTVTVTVNNTTVGGSVSGGSTICSGATSGLLTLSGHVGNIIRWESSVSPFTTWTPISNTTLFHTSGTLTETTQFRAVVQSGTCNASNSNSTTVTVNPTSDGGNIIGSNSICSGSSGGTLGLFDNIGNVIRWESSVTPFTSWSPINNTSNFLILGNLNDSTKYRAVVQSGNCAIGYSSVANIDVSPSVVAGSVNGPNNICSGSNPGNLVLTGNVGNVVRWESAVSPFIIFSPISNTTTSYNPGALTQTTQFRAVVQSGACGTATTSALTINISTSVSGGTVSAPFTAVCSGITPTQSVSLNGFSGSVTTWQMATGTAPYTWSNISGSANLSSITPSAATASTAYRALVQSGSCGSAVSDSIVIGVNAQSVGGNLTSNAPVCPNSNAILTLTSNVGNVVRWESAVAPFTNFVTISSTNNPYTSSSGITETTVFRAVVKSGVCAETNSSSHSVTINNNTSWIDPNNLTSTASWHDPVNWTCGVPTINSDVYISTINFGAFQLNPNITATANAHTIYLEHYGPGGGGGTIRMLNGSVLNLSGDLIFNVDLNSSFANGVSSSVGTINLVGASPQRIYTTAHPSGSHGSLLMGNINVNGTGTKTIDSKVRVINNLNLINGKVILNDSLTIDTNGIINGGSNASYIYSNTPVRGVLVQENIGTLGRIGPINFPVGTATSYNPITISNAGTKDNYKVRAIDDVCLIYTGGQIPNSAPLTSNAVNKTWFIDEQTPGGSDVTITLQWNAANELTGFTRASSYVAHHNGITWLASPAGAAAGSNPYTRTLSGVTSFSPFGVGSNGTLPVKWIRFNGVLANKITNLTWATASEINNKGFEVERSFNGTDFENIGFVKGAGNSNKVNGYEFPDNLSTTNYLNSTIYYRLKQLDFDGNFEYSNIITVKDNEFIEFGKEVTITPNPFTNEIQLNFSSANNATVKLILVDALGREIYNKNLTAITGTNNLVIDDLTVLKSGVYFARLESNGVVTKTVKLLKN